MGLFILETIARSVPPVPGSWSSALQTVYTADMICTNPREDGLKTDKRDKAPISSFFPYCPYLALCYDFREEDQSDMWSCIFWG